MIYSLILLSFLASASTHLLSSPTTTGESSPEDEKPLKESISHPHPQPQAHPHALPLSHPHLPEVGRKSKAIDLDDWYYWQSKKWPNRRRPHSSMGNYDQYYSWYPPSQSYLYPPRSYKPSRRNSISMGTPISAPSSTSYATTDTEGIQGVFAKWNPKINLTWPPSISVSSTNEYPEYSPSASFHHHHDDHHDDHYRQIQFIPIHMPCHHDHHHSKKKEISLIWPLIFLGLLFLPLLLGALLLPLAFLFITNIIQLLNLLQRLQQPQQQPAQGKRRKKRSFNYHPLIDEQIQLVADRLEKSLVKFLYLFSNDTSKVKSPNQSRGRAAIASTSAPFKVSNATSKLPKGHQS